MQRGAFFWGGILIIAGILFLLNTTGVLNVNVWALLWPIVFIAGGLWLLWGSLGRSNRQAEHITMELKGVEEAHLKIKFGAGQLTINGETAPEELLNGSFGTGLEYESKEQGDQLILELRPPDEGPLKWNNNRDWNIGLNKDIPMKLEMETGAGENTIDLEEMQVNQVNLKTGASRTTMRLPAQARLTDVSVDTGVSSLDLIIPEGVAGIISVEQGLSSIEIDEDRFPRHNGDYRSMDYESAENKVAISINIGVGSVSIR